MGYGQRNNPPVIIDECLNEIVDFDYEIEEHEEDYARDFKLDGKYGPKFSLKLNVHRSGYKTVISFAYTHGDTIYIPSFLRIKGEDMYAGSVYLDCKKLASGKRVEYYENGNLKAIKRYDNGYLIYEMTFRKDGSKYEENFIHEGAGMPYRINSYNINSKLYQYHIIKWGKRFRIKTYDAEGKLISRQSGKTKTPLK